MTKWKILQNLHFLQILNHLDKTELLEYDWDTSPTIEVPGDWNHQHPKLEYYEGTIWYRKKFNYQKNATSNRVFIHFGAVNYYTKVFLNGTKVGEHTGGFTPFQFEITDLLEDENSVVLYVNNKRLPEGVPTVNTDWYNYGGITRDVLLLETPNEFISDYFIQLDPNNNQQIQGYIESYQSSSNQNVTISIPELELSKNVTLEDGTKELQMSTDRIEYWSPDNPKLYEVIISNGHESIHDYEDFERSQHKDLTFSLMVESIFSQWNFNS